MLKGRAETEQERSAIRGPYRRDVDAVARSEAVRHIIASGFQQPDVGIRARANRGDAVPIGREAAENEGVWRTHCAGLIAVTVEPFVLTDGPRSAENQSPAAGSSRVRMIRQHSGCAGEFELLEIKRLRKQRFPAEPQQVIRSLAAACNPSVPSIPDQPRSIGRFTQRTTRSFSESPFQSH